MRLLTTVLAVSAVALAGCSSNDEPEVVKADTTPAAAAEPAAVTTTTAPVEPAPQPTPEDELREAAAQVDHLASSGDAAGAWEFYSQRCKNEIGSLEVYKAMLDMHYEGRTPNYTGWTVKVSGSSGQVVTVDSDPTAPADSMEPRTWTYIDGRWQFDNC